MPEGIGEIEEIPTGPRLEAGNGCPKGGDHEWVDVYGGHLSGTQDCVVGERCEKCRKYVPYSEPQC